MNFTRKASFTLALAIGLTSTPMAWTAEAVIEEMVIFGVRENRVSKGATGLAMDFKDTPQSISVISQEMMESFGASDINSALGLSPGLRVERIETNRSNYTARGFDIRNTQIDGVGMTNSWGIVTGDFDTYGYEKIEVVRGANGLLTGTGNASGTVNFVRKRPTNSAQGEIRATAGSWGSRRLEADYSTPFTESGNWAGRAVIATEESDSYLDGRSDERTFLYGVIDGQLTENSTLAIGVSYNDSNTDGNLWGALVFANNDGTQAEWDVGASTAQDWAFWNVETQTAFIEYAYYLPNDWELEASYNYRSSEEDNQLFYVYTIGGLDPDTGLGLYGWPGSYPGESNADIFELSLTGGYEAFGAEHELMVGINYAKGSTDEAIRAVASTEPAFGALPAFPYGMDVVAEPNWGPAAVYNEREDKLTRISGATRLHFGSFKAIFGFNAIDFERTATSLETPMAEDEISPYLGFTFDVNEDFVAYASYSDIYEPQDKYDFDEQYLAPTKGKNYELGVKSEWLDDRLLATLAVFKAEQLGIGTRAGINDKGRTYYTGQDVYSEGIELEVAGQINDYTTVSFGATYIDLEDKNGDTTNTWIPEERVTFSVYQELPSLPRLTLGLSGSWQSETSNGDSNHAIPVKQGSYLLADAFARWNFSSDSYVQANVSNLTDEKHITSLYWVGYYGADRNYSLSYAYKF